MTVLELSRWQFGITTVYQGWTYWVFRQRLTSSAYPTAGQAGPYTPAPTPVTGPEPAGHVGGRP
jgi:hypothetical protein